jgi:hypothetical protein
MRGILASLVNSWTNTLTAAQRAAWEMYAANTPTTDVMGAVLMLTGQQFFIRNNAPRVQAGLTTIVAAPTTYNNGEAVVEVAASASGTPNTLEIDTSVPDLEGVLTFGAPTDAAAVGLVYWYGNVNPSVNFWRGPYQLAAVTGTIGATSSTLVWTHDYVADWLAENLPAAGQRVPIRIRLSYADGRLSPAWRSIITIENVTP